MRQVAASLEESSTLSILGVFDQVISLDTPKFMSFKCSYYLFLLYIKKSVASCELEANQCREALFASLMHAINDDHSH